MAKVGNACETCRVFDMPAVGTKVSVVIHIDLRLARFYSLRVEQSNLGLSGMSLPDADMKAHNIISRHFCPRYNHPH